MEQNYLEDIYEMIDYQLDQDNPASYRLRSQNVNVLVGSQTRDKVIRSNWGDDIAGDEVLNPAYNPESFTDCSMRTRRNLMRLNEEKIDYELIQSLLVHIDENFDEGAVLVFLPGMAEINNLYDQLTSSYHFGKEAAKRDWIMPLHSNISPEEQRGVFKNPPKGIRKFVLATNIAETSITIDDIVFVVDCGKAKEKTYDAVNKLCCLLPTWVSRASVRQRKGRAGRVRAGKCFHVYTRELHDNQMAQYQLPEILRTPLEELCLQIKSLQLGNIEMFLGKALEPPDLLSIHNAVELLEMIGALTEAEELTALGEHLAALPVDPKIGKMILMGAIFGCLDPVLTIAAGLSYRDPFVMPLDKKEILKMIKLKKYRKD